MQGMMNSRGRPTILKGSTRETISLDHAVAVFYILRIFHSQSKRKCRKYINFCKCLLCTFVVKYKRYVFVALVFTLTFTDKIFLFDIFLWMFYLLFYSLPHVPERPKDKLSKEQLLPPTPSVYLDNKKDAFSPQLQEFCQEHPITVVRGMCSLRSFR